MQSKHNLKVQLQPSPIIITQFLYGLIFTLSKIYIQRLRLQFTSTALLISSCQNFFFLWLQNLILCRFVCDFHLMFHHVDCKTNIRRHIGVYMETETVNDVFVEKKKKNFVKKYIIVLCVCVYKRVLKI